MDECPTGEELSRYAVGDLPSDRFECVAAHVDGCAACQRALATSPADAFVAAVTDAAQDASPERASPPTLPVPVDAVVRRIAGHGIDLPLPYRVGEYQLVEKVGAGGMGAVYRAVHARLGRSVAVKLIAPLWKDRQDVLARFGREMWAVG